MQWRYPGRILVSSWGLAHDVPLDGFTECACLTVLACQEPLSQLLPWRATLVASVGLSSGIWYRCSDRGAPLVGGITINMTNVVLSRRV